MKPALQAAAAFRMPALVGGRMGALAPKRSRLCVGNPAHDMRLREGGMAARAQPPEMPRSGMQLKGAVAP